MTNLQLLGPNPSAEQLAGLQRKHSGTESAGGGEAGGEGGRAGRQAVRAACRRLGHAARPRPRGRGRVGHGAERRAGRARGRAPGFTPARAPCLGHCEGPAGGYQSLPQGGGAVPRDGGQGARGSPLAGDPPPGLLALEIPHPGAGCRRAGVHMARWRCPGVVDPLWNAGGNP
jgi:hypothetical protein